MEGYIVKQQAIEEFEGILKVHFLNDKAVRINKSLGDLTGLTALGFHLIEIEPGHLSTEFHRHYFEEECVYILQGQAEARIGGQLYQVSEGDFIGYRAGGEAHTLRNNGSEILRCLVVGNRLDHDVADYPDLNKRLFRNPGHDYNLVDIDAIELHKAGKKA